MLLRFVRSSSRLLSEALHPVAENRVRFRARDVELLDEIRTRAEHVRRAALAQSVEKAKMLIAHDRWSLAAARRNALAHHCCCFVVHVHRAAARLRERQCRRTFTLLLRACA